MRAMTVVGILAVSAAIPVAAQSALYRSHNLDGSWVAVGGVVQFNFVHRFYVSGSEEHKVTNFPGFTLAAGLGHDLMLGLHYTSNSLQVQTPYTPNEAELFARWRPLGEEAQDGFAVGVTGAYNTAAKSFDAELAGAYTRGRFTATGALRALSKPFGFAVDSADLAAGVGLIFRLNDFVAISGDYTTMISTDTAAAWSAGLSFVIPGSPHTFSLHASRALSNTLQGSAWGFEKTLYGFEFTIPLHLSRFAPWFGGGNGRGPAVAAAANVAAEVEMAAFRYLRDTVYVARGQAVRWINADAVEHTVTFDAGGPQSSATLPARGAFVTTFDRPGTYAYRCTPHPNMQGVVVVR
jgi:plastocyanin